MSNSRNNSDSHQSNVNLNGNGHRTVENSSSYRDGYLHGRVTEHQIQENKQDVRENNKIAKGLIIGIGVTALVALGVAAMFIFSPRGEEDILIEPPPVEDSIETETQD